jgi:hypothetical protein
MGEVIYMQKSWPWFDPRTGALRQKAQVNFGFHTDSSVASHVVAASALSGGALAAFLAMTGALTAAETLTTDTAANIIAAVPYYPYVGVNWRLRILNESSGNYAWTVAAGSGVTLTGTATIAQNTWREFLVTITGVGTPAVTLQSVGVGTWS